jgi:hypothetical protein
MRKRTRLAGLAFIAVLTASCASSSSTEPVEVGAPAATNAAGGEPATSESASLVAPLLGGGSFDLSSELATAPVAMWFWAPG